MLRDLNQVLPVTVGLGVIVLSLIIYRLYVAKEKEKTGTSKGTRSKTFLQDPTAKYPVPLIAKIEVSHDTKTFRFGLPSKDHILGLPIGQHIHLSAKIDGDLIIRSYTPVTSDEDHGYFDLIIKVYFKNVHPRFPDGGKMSQHLNNMKIGETIDIRGPSGRLQYVGNGTFSIKKLRKDPPETVKVSKISMIAGGTGITPMLQIIRHIARNPDDKVLLRLLYANQSEQDILLREQLEQVERDHPDQFKLWYTIDRPEKNWKYSSGFVNDEMIKDHLFPPSKDHIVLMCGPPPMINYACLPNLEKIGHDKDMCFAY